MREDILDKMRELRDLREREIFEEQGDEAKSVENIIYVGEININGIEERIFLIQEKKDENVQEYFVNDKGERIAMLTEIGIILYESAFSSVDDAEKIKAELQEKISEMNKDGKNRGLKEEEKKRIKNVAEELGIEENDIEQMAEIDLEQEVKSEDEEKEVDKEEIKKVRLLQESDIDVKVDERQTIGQILDVETSNQKPDKKFVKFAVVYADSLKTLDGKNGGNETYAFVGIRQDGSAQRLDDILEIDSSFGTMNTEETLKHDAKGKESEMENSADSRYKIKGTNKTFSIDNAQYGEITIHYGTRAQGSNEISETQLETSNVRQTSRQVRETQSGVKGQYHSNKQLKEANSHFDVGEDEVDIKDADGNINTYTHEHDEDDKYIPGTDTTWTKFANACGYGNDAEYAKEVFIKEREKTQNDSLSNEELVEKVIEDKENEFDRTTDRK